MAYTCYACNKFYPQQPPEPFWICPKCKGEQKEHPPLLPLYWVINPREQDGIRQLAKQNNKEEK
jgi:hypothetical protein